MKIDLNTLVSNIVNSKPNATQDELRFDVRSALQDAKNKGAKVSKKDFAEANSLVMQLKPQEIKANFATPVTSKTSEAVRSLNNEASKKYVQDLEKRLNGGISVQINPNQKLAEESALTFKQGSAKESFKVFEQAGLIAPPNNRANRRGILIDGLIDSKSFAPASFDEHLNNLRAEGRSTIHEIMAMPRFDETELEYVSSKKQKANKAKENATRQKAVHVDSKAAKAARNEKYMLENGIVNKKGKPFLDKVKDLCSGKLNVNVSKPNVKSAEESFKVFEELAPQLVKEPQKLLQETLLPETKEIVEETIKNSTKGLSKVGKLGIAIAAVTAAAGGIYAALTGKKNQDIVIEERIAA